MAGEGSGLWRGAFGHRLGRQILEASGEISHLCFDVCSLPCGPHPCPPRALVLGLGLWFNCTQVINYWVTITRCECVSRFFYCVYGMLGKSVRTHKRNAELEVDSQEPAGHPCVGAVCLALRGGCCSGSGPAQPSTAHSSRSMAVGRAVLALSDCA